MSKARGPYRVDPLGYKKAQKALDKMAENARELGLDYEPVWDNLPSNKDVEDAMRLKRLSQLAEKPAQQEKDWGAVGEAHIAAIKKSSKAMVEDAVVRAAHKVMAEFEAKSDERLMKDWGPGPHEYHSLPAQQQPVAHPSCKGMNCGITRTDQEHSIECQAEHAAAIAGGQFVKPEQEPVAWICEGSSSDEKHAIDYWPGDVDDLPIGTQLYASPPAQRKPLTNGEIYTAYITATNQTLRAQDERLAFAFARAIEAAHGIKENT